ncbi:probable RNA polymerase II nuclear localization protein SLC7A6OS [Amphibalanus amphitrite]|uniref:probable RNA polymerase II nuclear localization protein SLC7A6OS n=1 Tax=Amphibalanus amphitrite TaxID=1232801 RepID=UPI001C909A8B|nr:probable RNA polymerase II nuclear localization protein SLC7A6OS [Amphibalanus amphitrite]XP_043214439.1 probable RNA polymerase II nuclear localization protein SLC7A6OS [Amphibalanus amphitrite]
MTSVIRIKRKVGDDPQQALLATKRRRLHSGDEAAASSSSDTPLSAVLQFVGTMKPEDTTLPDAALSAVRAQRKSGAARRDPMSVPAAVERAKEARRARLQDEQKARRYRIVARRRGEPDGESADADSGLASLPGVIDVEEESPAAAATSKHPSGPGEQLTCNGQVMERVAVPDPTSTTYVYDLYVSSAPLSADDDLLELRPCDDVQLWDHRAARHSDSDDPFADDDDDSNDEDNWRNDYPEELGDSDYERYMDPVDGAEFDLIRRMEAHEIAGDDEVDEPLAYGLDELEEGGGKDPYDKYKARVLRQINGEDSDSDGDGGYLADSGDGSDEEEGY